MYSLDFEARAASEWKALEKSIAAQFLKVLARRLHEPEIPSARLSGDLAGCYKITLLKQGFRLIYLLNKERSILLVISVGRREDKQAYRLAAERLQRFQ
ncbi:MAG: type II toxin-antitoxin system RelE/ParE family toxin [Actinobacteria bacterium]|nr:type II toxin-antitoxin system RelE/ParE family toxin [Actinomycetota bacterium]